MKTARLLTLLMGLGALTQGVSFAESSTQAAPKAPAQKVEADGNHSGKGEKENQTRDKTESPAAGHSGEKQEGHKASSQTSGHPNNKPADKHTTAERPQGHGAITHGSTTGHASGLPSSGKTAGNVPSKVTPGNAVVQHPPGSSKPVGTANGGPMAKKTENISGRPAAASANKLPTTPSVNAERGRVPGLATIGGPAKPSAGNTAAISGTGIKSRP